MDAFQIARARSMQSEDPSAFMRGFFAGLHAVERDVNTDRQLRQAEQDGNAPFAAGLIEGLAAANAEAGLPMVCAAPYWRRNMLRGRAVTA